MECCICDRQPYNDIKMADITGVYIVTAYRFGDRNNHSYNLGVFSSMSKAVQCADDHFMYRGGKYECIVEAAIVDRFNNEDDEYTEEVYRSTSQEKHHGRLFL